jgi:predicted kinase
VRVALGHLHDAQVRLVLVGGAPGTGKSTVASGLSDRFGWVLLRSDEVRKDVTGVGRGTPSSARVDQGIYSPAATDRTYTELLRRAELALRHGDSVVLDATWSDASRRAAAAHLADEASADLVQVRCDAPVDVAAARIDLRLDAATDASDADTEVATAMRSRFDPWPTASTLSTLAAPADVLAAAVDLVGRTS